MLNIFRKKPIGKIDVLDTKFARCLNLFDLISLGIGCVLGVGVYVVSGSMSRTLTGPGACLSFLFAALTSSISAFCYAEFAARVPRCGSAYTYSYVTVGEFVAFIIGWDMVLEYIIGTASVAKGLSNYIDSLCGYLFSSFFKSLWTIDVPHLASYTDFLAILLVILFCCLLAAGVRRSATFGNFCVIVNMLTIGVVIITGLTKIDPNNWFIPVDKIPEEYRESAGTGGFLPFGFAGVMAGAAQSFFAFVGFDAIAAAGEEAKNPKTDISRALLACTVICTFVYFSVSTIVTMLVPYYEQDIDAPFVYAFEKAGLPIVKYVVGSGAICSLTSSLLNGTYPMPRIIYSMAEDGLFFKVFAKVHPTYKTPTNATLLVGLLATVMAAIIDFEELVEMLSIGTLIAYSMVAMCVLVLRYKCNDNEEDNGDINQKEFKFFSQLFNSSGLKVPTRLSNQIIHLNLFGFAICSFLVSAFLVFYNRFISIQYPIQFSLFMALVIVMILNMISMSCQPVQKVDIYFMTPLVPFLPCISIFCNIYMIMTLAVITWIRYIVWLVIGLSIYFGYGIWNSKEAIKQHDIEMGEISEKTN